MGVGVAITVACFVASPVSMMGLFVGMFTFCGGGLALTVPVIRATVRRAMNVNRVHHGLQPVGEDMFRQPEPADDHSFEGQHFTSAPRGPVHGWVPPGTRVSVPGEQVPVIGTKPQFNRPLHEAVPRPSAGSPRQQDGRGGIS